MKSNVTLLDLNKEWESILEDFLLRCILLITNERKGVIKNKNVVSSSNRSPTDLIMVDFSHLKQVKLINKN